MVMDVFSKFWWAEPLKFKTGAAVKARLENNFKEQIPRKVWSDTGTEFSNKEVRKLLTKHNITLYST